jgi:hypothetical protein
MYGVSYSQGLWSLVVRATGNVYYADKLSNILSLVEQPLS